jgi:DNA-binding response OmpR family regulator
MLSIYRPNMPPLSPRHTTVEMAFDQPILIVDQEGPFRAMLAAALRATGFAIYGAINAQQALCASSQIKPALILLNLTTCNPEEQALCTTLHELYDIPIVVMAKAGEAIAMLNAFAAGATAFVPMPFALEELEAQIKKAWLCYTREAATLHTPDDCHPYELNNVPPFYQERSVFFGKAL